MLLLLLLFAAALILRKLETERKVAPADLRWWWPVRWTGEVDVEEEEGVSEGVAVAVDGGVGRSPLLLLLRLREGRCSRLRERGFEAVPALEGGFDEVPALERAKGLNQFVLALGGLLLSAMVAVGNVTPVSKGVVVVAVMGLVEGTGGCEVVVGGERHEREPPWGSRLDGKNAMSMEN